MFVITLKYVAALEAMDAHMKEHMTFLRKHYKSNTFLTSGRQVPRTGGIILAVGPSKEEIESIMREDPFCQHGLAEFTVTEFLNSQMHPEFKAMLERITGSWALGTGC